jgi:hypothetical protein
MCPAFLVVVGVGGVQSKLSVRTVPGSPAANPGDTLKSSLTPGTTLNFTTAPGGPAGLFGKRSSWVGQTLSNPPAPGTAVLKLLNLFTIDPCFDNSPTVTGVSSVTVGDLPATMTVGGTSGYPIQILPSTGPLVSRALPACGTAPTAFLTGQYSPVLDATTGGTTVYVN